MSLQRCTRITSGNVHSSLPPGPTPDPSMKASVSFPPVHVALIPALITPPPPLPSGTALPNEVSAHQPLPWRLCFREASQGSWYHTWFSEVAG